MRQRAANLRVSHHQASLPETHCSQSPWSPRSCGSGRSAVAVERSELPARVLRKLHPIAARRGTARLSLPRFRLEAVSSAVAAVVGVRHWSDPSANYSARTAKLPDFETNRIRVERVSGGPPGYCKLHLRPLLRILWAGSQPLHPTPSRLKTDLGVDLTESWIPRAGRTRTGAPCFSSNRCTRTEVHARRAAN